MAEKKTNRTTRLSEKTGEIRILLARTDNVERDKMRIRLLLFSSGMGLRANSERCQTDELIQKKAKREIIKDTVLFFSMTFRIICS